MAYYYPQTYPTYSQGNNVLWVQGQAAAESYPVAPSGRIVMMDSTNPVAYVKSADASGRPYPLEIYDLVKREPVPVPEYVTKEELMQILAEETEKSKKKGKEA